MRKKSSLLFTLSIVIFLLIFPLISADDNEGGLTRGDLIIPVEAIIFLFMTGAIILNAKIVLKFGKSLYGTPFIYILFGLILMELTRILYMLFDFRFLNLSHETLNFLWHMVFYIGMVSFIIALQKIKNTAQGNKKGIFSKKDYYLLSSLGILTVILLIIAFPLDRWLNSAYVGSAADKLGLQHFLAFILAGLLASYLLWIKINKEYSGEFVSTIITPFLLFLILMSLNHFWELLTENWKIILLSDEIIEKVEQLFWLPASIILFYGFLSLNKIIKKSI